jgi:3-deoxy-7-phosphoheptulonate synthase
MGLPLATEALDPNSVRNTWAICSAGQRLVRARLNLKLTVRWLQGLSMPVGFKNGTDGSLGTAINAMRAAAMATPFCRYKSGWASVPAADSG